jgi:hypothetical protein
MRLAILTALTMLPDGKWLAAAMLAPTRGDLPRTGPERHAIGTTRAEASALARAAWELSEEEYRLHFAAVAKAFTASAAGLWPVQ